MGRFALPLEMKSVKALSSIALLCLLIIACGEGQMIPDMPAHPNNSTGLEFPGSPVELFDQSLDNALKIYSPLVLDCWELGCWPCQKMETTIDQMASDFKGEIVFGKLCTDFNPATTGKYEISRTPTLLIFRNGTLIHKHVGNYPREELEDIILTALRGADYGRPPIEPNASAPVQWPKILK